MIRSVVTALALASATCALPAFAQAQAAPAQAQAVPDSELPRGRLSDAAAPSAYRLDLTVDPAQPRFSGKVEIDVTLKQASSRIFLHAAA